MIQDTAWSPRFVPSTTATAATSGEAIAGTDTTKFITPSLLQAATSYHAGPVVNARAPRQGLVFDGTTGVSVSTPALGTADFSISFFVRRDSSSVQQYLVGNDNSGCFYVGFRTTGALYSGKAAGSANGDLNIGNVVGKWQHIVLVRSGGNITGYADGVSVGSVTDVGSNYTTGAYSLFQASSGAAALVGAALSPYIYNRALSASEVVALYEAGAPAGADYNSASNTAVYSTDFSTSTGWTAETGWSITGGVAVLSGSNAGALYRSAVSSLKQGSRYRITFTVASYVSGGVRPWIQIGSSRVLGTARTANGTYTEEIIAPSATGSSYVGIEASTSAACSLNVDDYSYFNSGLLLAPDAAQAGGGLTWYDTSGNAANITLPASGVSWNVPTSASYAGGWSFGSGGGNVGIGLTNPTGGQLHVQGNSDAASGPNRPRIAITNQAGTAQTWTIQSWQSSGDANLSIYRTAAAGGILLASTGGRVGVGVTSFSGSGALELATHTTSAGGIGFGTDTSLYRTAAGFLQVDSLSGNNPAIKLAQAGVAKVWMEYYAPDLRGYITTADSLAIRTNGGTTALTLDSSQRVKTASTLNVGDGTSDSQFVNVFTNKVNNTSGPVTINLPADSSGVVTLYSSQSGIGKSMWQIPYINDGGTVQLGTAVKTIKTADPVSSAVAATGAITVSVVAANTYCFWGINCVKP